MGALAIGGCREPRRRPAAAPGMVIDAGAIDSSEIRTVRVPDETRELVVVTTADWEATAATMSRWRRGPDGWQRVGAPWSAVVGRTGLGWGRGVHGDGAPDGLTGPDKREGDGRAPAGLFALGAGYGYAAAPPSGTRLPYRALTESWRCVDDPASPRYGQVFDAAGLTVDWRSAEDMRRADALYAWVIDVRHNPAAVPGGGSCIFLHVWAGADDTTVGCTAMAEPDLVTLVAGLDPAARPLLVQLPAPVYGAVAAAWGLPSI